MGNPIIIGRLGMLLYDSEVICLNNNLLINTKYGKVQGFQENNINKWYGIPFAKPPIHELRFKRAQSPEPWQGTKECTKMGNRPYQFTDEKILKKMGLANENIRSSEDCLNLNIWAPKSTKKAPVFVWIYGGGNHIGEASSPAYSLESFAEQGVIGVSFNYRLGPLGFYNFSKLDSSFDSNCAVSDMILAMQWIKNNIENFGGDSNNITIAGESAGGTAVYSLLAAPKAKGTFQKAIAMSGLSGNITTQKTHDLNNEIFFDKLGLDSQDIYKLKEMPVENMINPSKAVFEESCSVNPGIFVTGPVIDDLIPKKPWDALNEGINKDVKCMFGTCRDEGTLFYSMHAIPKSWSEVSTMLSRNNRLDKYPYFKELYGNQSEKKAMFEIGRDRLFWANTIKCAIAQSKYNDVYAYRFDYSNPLKKMIGLGAHHGADVSPALNTQISNKNRILNTVKNRGLKKVRNVLHGSFVNFAISGNPNGGLPLKWPKYTNDTQLTYIINTKCSVLNNPNSNYFAIWDDLKLYE